MIDWHTPVWTHYGIEPTVEAIAAYCAARGWGFEWDAPAVPRRGTPTYTVTITLPGPAGEVWLAGVGRTLHEAAARALVRIPTAPPVATRRSVMDRGGMALGVVVLLIALLVCVGYAMGAVFYLP